MKLIIFFAMIFLIIKVTKAQHFKNDVTAKYETEVESSKPTEGFKATTTGRVNLFIITREKKEKMDFVSFSILLRGRIKSFFHHRKFYVIKARSSKEATAKVERILRKKRKLINTLWFDSHGYYGNRYSSFRIGSDQYYYMNIRDTGAIKYLQILARYCDDKTKVGLGACYAGADFYFPATDSTPGTRMNGDSLMIGLGDIFKKSTIYASESWVMAKPGIFSNGYGFAGWPIQRSSKDSVYAPVWKRIGKWRKYSKVDGKLESIPTVALDESGNIHTRVGDYNNFRKSRKKVAKALKDLRPGVAKFNKGAYQRDPPIKKTKK